MNTDRLFQTVKGFARRLTPAPVLAWRRENKLQEIRSAMSAQPDTRGIFTTIYERNYWGAGSERYYSGSGSHDAETVTRYVDAVRDFIVSTKEKLNVVDLGCGDFAIGSKIRPFADHYVACDIVEGLIAQDRTKYEDLNVDFRVVDIIDESLPDGDLVLVRQVLQHLSNDHIAKVIAKLSKYRFAIITEHHPPGQFTPNLDKPTGPDIRISIGKEGSGVVVTEPPFSLKPKSQSILCQTAAQEGGRASIITTTAYQL